MSDKLPPHNQQAELATIGACLTEPKTALPDAQQRITSAEFFYDARCQFAWDVISKIEPDKLDEIKFLDAAKAISGINHQFVMDCQKECFSAANLPEWLAIVERDYAMRRVIKVCAEYTRQAYESSSIELLDGIERDILAIRPENRDKKDLAALMREAVDIIEIKSQKWDSISGITTGIPDLDRLTDGLHEGEFVVIGAYPSCGKTALAVNMAMANATNGTPVGILSAEMRPVQLLIRSICSESRVNFRKMTEADIAKMIPVMANLKNSPIEIEKASGFTIGQVIAAARRMKQKSGIKMLVLDYIQLIAGTGDNREQVIASVSRGLKQIAGELSIPVIGLSQLNDDGKLRESRAIGQDADSVWILSNNGEWQPKVQPVKLDVQKTRDGETGKVDLTFFKEYTRFEQASQFSEIPTNQD
jgi:replicative DNA helicase